MSMNQDFNLTSVHIQSERLTLVPISPTYRDDIFREFTDEITVHMYPPTPSSIADTDAFIDKSIRERIAGTDLVLAILREGTFIGNCGLHRINTLAPEFGIWIIKSAHGRGYGREAVAALKVWADNNLTYDHIEYPVVNINTASRKVAESLGGVVHHEFQKKNGRGEERTMIMYHIPRSA